MNLIKDSLPNKSERWIDLFQKAGFIKENTGTIAIKVILLYIYSKTTTYYDCKRK